MRLWWHIYHSFGHCDKVWTNYPTKNSSFQRSDSPASSTTYILIARSARINAGPSPRLGIRDWNVDIKTTKKTTPGIYASVTKRREIQHHTHLAQYPLYSVNYYPLLLPSLKHKNKTQPIHLPKIQSLTSQPPILSILNPSGASSMTSPKRIYNQTLRFHGKNIENFVPKIQEDRRKIPSLSPELPWWTAW